MANYDGDITLKVDLEPGNITSTANSLRKEVENIANSSRFRQTSDEFKNLHNNMNKAYIKAGELLTTLKNLENMKMPTTHYAQLQTELDKLDKKYQTLNTQRKLMEAGGQTNSKAYERVGGQLQYIFEQADKVRSKMASMEQHGLAFIDPTTSSVYKSTLNALNDVNNQLTIYIKQATTAQTVGAPDSEGWHRYDSSLRNTKNSMSSTEKQLKKLAKHAADVAKSFANMAKSAVKSFANMAKSAAKAAGRGIIGGFKRLASAITKTNKASSNANGTFKKGFLFLLRYALGIRSIYFLFRRLRKALGEGIGNLAQYSSPFNQVISNFISALTRLKNTFATAFAPIINVVLPIITTFINAISAAVTKVGMLIAALTGKKTFIAAKAVQEDFAGSMDGAADAANGANEAAKEYQRTISGFDDVEILKEPDKNGSPGGGGGGGGGGGNGIDPSDMFETVELPAGYYDLAQMIKDAWANADFTDLGVLLGQKIAEALYNIPWDTIQQYAGKFGKSFATFINGLISVPELATAIGYTIGQALNTLFILANNFVSNLNWEQVGQFFADVMNEGIKTIKWNLIADTFATTANGIFNAVGTWAEKFNFTALGTKIKETVEYLLNHLEWSDIKSAFANLGKGLADFINAALSPSNENNSDGIKADGIATALGKTIGQGINTLFSGASTFVTGLNWKNIGDFFASVMNAGIATITWSTIVDTLATAANGVFNVAKTWSSKFNFTALGTKIEQVVSGVLSGLEWNDVKTAATNLGTGVANLINNAVTPTSIGAVGTALGEAVTSLIKGVKAFAISFSGSNLGSSIATGINNFFNKLDLEEAGVTLATITNKIADVLITAIKETDWESVGGNIVRGIEGFFRTLDVSKFPETLAAIAKAIKDLIVGALKEISWDDIINLDLKLADLFSNILHPEQSLQQSILDALFGNDNGTGPSGHSLSTTATVTVDAEETDNYKNVIKGKDGYINVKDDTATKTASGVLETAFSTVKNTFDEFKSNTATKFIAGSTKDSKGKDTFTSTKTTFGGFKSNTATKYIAGSEKDSNKKDTFGSTLKIFKDFKSNTATKFIAGSKKDSNKKDTFGSTLKIFKDFKSNTATKYLAGNENGTGKNKGTFKKTKKAFTEVSNNTVKLIAVGRKENSFTSVLTALSNAAAKKYTLAQKAIRDVPTNGGHYAMGGVFLPKAGWKNIAQYASGGAPTHGTMFVAGEAGAEAVGHIHGRTEVLNQSQMAAVMYSSVIAGVAPVINYMKECTNAIIRNIGSELNYLKFMSGQLYSINTLSNTLSTNVGNIVTGKVVPNNFNSNDMNNLNQTLDKLSSMLYDTRSNAVTREELTSILTTMFTRYMNFSCYIGDEDIARHANNGNARLEMRFSPVAR